jgi:hypothetical protein
MANIEFNIRITIPKGKNFIYKLPLMVVFIKLIVKTIFLYTDYFSELKQLVHIYFL